METKLKTQVGLKAKMCNYFHTHALFGGFINMLTKMNFFALNLSFSVCSCILYHRGVEKGWLVTFLIILPQMSAFFVMSLIQTAGHTVAALVDVFLQLSNVNFSPKMWNWERRKKTKKERKQQQLLCVCFCCCWLFHARWQGLWCFCLVCL